MKDEQGNPTILYKDKDGNFLLTPEKYPEIKDLKFVIENFEKILLENDEKEVIFPLPSVTIEGIEGVCSEKYSQYNLVPKDKDFFTTQIMILASELLDILKEHRDKLKESGNELFKIFEQKYKEVF